MAEKTVYEKIMEVLEAEASKPVAEYTNPNFLSELVVLLDDYGGLEIDAVTDYANDMWGR